MLLDNHFFGELGNGILAFSALAITVISGKRRLDRKINDPHGPFVDAIFLMALAVLVNSVWWYLAREHAPDGRRHVIWMAEYSSMMTMTTAVLYGIGAIKYLKFIGDHNGLYPLIGGSIIVGAAFILAWL